MLLKAYKKDSGRTGFAIPSATFGVGTSGRDLQSRPQHLVSELQAGRDFSGLSVSAKKDRLNKNEKYKK